jgi:hypothetical protein
MTTTPRTFALSCYPCQPRRLRTKCAERFDYMRPETAEIATRLAALGYRSFPRIPSIEGRVGQPVGAGSCLFAAGAKRSPVVVLQTPSKPSMTRFSEVNRRRRIDEAGDSPERAPERFRSEPGLATPESGARQPVTAAARRRTPWRPDPRLTLVDRRVWRSEIGLVDAHQHVRFRRARPANWG